MLRRSLGGVEERALKNTKEELVIVLYSYICLWRGVPGLYKKGSAKKIPVWCRRTTTEEHKGRIISSFFIVI